jgi:hypothetical protein
MEFSFWLTPFVRIAILHRLLTHYYMKYLVLTFVLLSSQANCQQIVEFWTEDFGFGSTPGQLASQYSGIFGSWTMTETGANVGTSNMWFISDEENGNDPGDCGTAGGSNQTLHIGANGSFAGTDLGASYYEGLDVLCDVIDCGATDLRIETPSISAVTLANIQLQFDYLEGGNNIDNATLWYFDGFTWAQIADMDKTFGTCDPQGLWTSYSIALPASANDNTNFKIGFRWVNNDDADATDPSIAIDNIVLIGTFGEITTAPEVTCIGDIEMDLDADCVAFLDDYIPTVIVFDPNDPFPIVMQSPEPGTPIFEPTLVTMTATNGFDLSGECSFMVFPIDNTPPAITCPAPVNLSLPPGECSMFVDIPLAIATDNCSVDLVSNSFNSTPDASDIYSIGMTTVTYTATDAAGLSASCVAFVSLTISELPDLQCPAEIIIGVPFGTTSSPVDVPVPLDLSGCDLGALTNDFNGTSDASDVYPVGTTTVCWTFEGINGETLTCCHDIIVADDLECCLGDFNCDGIIAVADLLEIVADFGCLSNCGIIDLDDDGIVGVSDMLIFNGLFGTFCE